MPLGKEVCLGPGHIVLDGEPGSQLPDKGAQPPIFGPCLVAKRSPISAVPFEGRGSWVGSPSDTMWPWAEAYLPTK